ncbi:MAG: DNA/RNA non-specific endonuclease [Phycisphaerales bacterium]|nr:DNA/RNA non-specific endonuclease [Phycisphaerales bacterium]
MQQRTGIRLFWLKVSLGILAILCCGVGVWVGCQKHVAPRSVAASAEELTSEGRMVFGGLPRAKEGQEGREVGNFTVLRNVAYVVGYSEGRKTPLFACYRVIREQPFKLDRPKGNFLTDTRTQARVKHQDFTGSGYDRGHMAPNSAIAKCFGEQAQTETFLLTNICPQAPALNQKVWEELEKRELVYAVRFGEVWVMDGPVFADASGGTTHKLRSGIAVPAAFWKILLEDEGGGKGGEERVHTFAVIMPQTVAGTEKPAQFATAIDNIEKETGLEFLWKLSSGKQRMLKGTISREW